MPFGVLLPYIPVSHQLWIGTDFLIFCCEGPCEGTPGEEEI